MTSSIRILIVDDYAPWRKSLRAILRNHPESVVLGEAEDGLEAVQKAGELLPNLILLDIGLPQLDGLQAAKQILEITPGMAIVFVTLNNDPIVIDAALSDGAKGYVLKLDAIKELWPAIESVLQGKRFVSSGVAAG